MARPARVRCGRGTNERSAGLTGSALAARGTAGTGGRSPGTAATGLPGRTPPRPHLAPPPRASVSLGPLRLPTRKAALPAPPHPVTSVVLNHVLKGPASLGLRSPRGLRGLRGSPHVTGAAWAVEGEPGRRGPCGKAGLPRAGRRRWPREALLLPVAARGDSPSRGRGGSRTGRCAKCSVTAVGRPLVCL